MEIVNSSYLRTHYSRYLKRVTAGETFLIAKRGRVVLRLEPLDPFKKLKTAE